MMQLLQFSLLRLEVLAHLLWLTAFQANQLYIKQHTHIWWYSIHCNNIIYTQYYIVNSISCSLSLQHTIVHTRDGLLLHYNAFDLYNMLYNYIHRELGVTHMGAVGCFSMTSSGALVEHLNLWDLTRSHWITHMTSYWSRGGWVAVWSHKINDVNNVSLHPFYFLFLYRVIIG